MTASSIDAGGLVLGGDLGGTSTRILVTDLDGRVVGQGRAGGGNPTAHPATARDELVAALRDALRDAEPGRVQAGVLGMAGGGALRDPVVRAAYDEAWRAAGLRGLPEIRSDVEVAFAAGSDATTGTVLVAGTGAVAGRVEGGRLVETAGGHGWLLGDEGSGFWLGREAVRAALRWVGSGEPPGALVRSVLEAVGASEDDARTLLVEHAYSRPPVALAELAPLATAAHDGGDPVAAEIVTTALDHLLALLERLPPPSPGEPVVLAGALTARGTAIGHGLRRHLGKKGLDVLSAAEPVTGAAAIARRDLRRNQGA